MLWAACVADALLAPYEKLSGNKRKPQDYVEKITEETFYTRTTRFGHFCQYAPGQGTDDSDMLKVLLKHVVDGRVDESLILAYIRWANSGTESLGNNTKRLLHGYGCKNAHRATQTYRDHFAKAFPTAEARERQQSNGHLMRCAPLALIDDDCARAAAISFDCGITNPSSVCLKVSSIYIEVLRALLAAESDDFGQHVDHILLRHASEAEGDLKQALVDGLCRGPFPRKLSGKDRCWTLNSFCAALFFARAASSFSDGMRSIVALGGDTDTNGCILGGLLGARFGEQRLLEEDANRHNMDMILRCKASVRARTRGGPEKFSLRPTEYSMQTALDTMDGIVHEPPVKKARGNTTSG